MEGEAEERCLLFSQYVEGAAFNKALRLKNNCQNTTLLLNQFELVFCANQCDSASSKDGRLALPAKTLKPNQSFLAVNPNANIPVDQYVDEFSSKINMNGNDAWAIAKVHTGEIVDAIGEFDTTLKKSGWNVAGVASATVDHTLFRKKNFAMRGNGGDWVSSAGTSADESEWIVAPKDTWSLDSNNSIDPSSAADRLCPVTTTTCNDFQALNSRVDRREDVSRLVVATWNAEWLYDGRCDPNMSPWAPGSQDCAGRMSGLNSCDVAGAKAHQERAASVMKRLNVDVWNVAEVESCEMLAECASHMNFDSEHEFEYYMLQGTDTFLRQQVGLITRLPLVYPLERSEERHSYPVDSKSRCGQAPPGRSGISKHYSARLQFELPSGELATLAILGMHLKAIPTQPYACHKREAQARLAAKILARALNETPFVIAMGDFNDFDGNVCCLDASGSQPTSRVLQMLKNPRSSEEDELHSVVQLVPREYRYTAWWDHDPQDGVDQGLSEHSSLDHILVSSDLFKYLQSVHIDHSMHPGDVSDHWPLIATFNFSSQVGPANATSPPYDPRSTLVHMLPPLLATLGGVGLLVALGVLFWVHLRRPPRRRHTAVLLRSLELRPTKAP